MILDISSTVPSVVHCPSEVVSECFMVTMSIESMYRILYKYKYTPYICWMGVIRLWRPGIGWMTQKCTTNPLILRGCSTWWHHGMETISVLLALCEGNPPVTNGYPPVTDGFLHTRPVIGAFFIAPWCRWIWRQLVKVYIFHFFFNYCMKHIWQHWFHPTTNIVAVAEKTRYS